MFYIARYPVRWVAQSSLISSPGRHVHSDTKSASPGSIPPMQQLPAKTKSLTSPPLSIFIYKAEWTGTSAERTKMANLRRGNKGDSDSGSRDCESGILPLSYRTPHKTQSTFIYSTQRKNNVDTQLHRAYAYVTRSKQSADRHFMQIRRFIGVASAIRPILSEASTIEEYIFI